MNFTRPELLSLYDLITNRLFKIPDYQRTYSWKKKQCTDLFTDILKVKEKNKEHFMATIVCLSKDKKQIGGSRFDVLDIVDGQQRITTLIILLKALCNALEKGSLDEKNIADDLKKILVKEKDDTIILLQTNHDTSNIFADYIRNAQKVSKDELIIEAEKNLFDAFILAEKFVESFGLKYGLTSLYEIVMDKLKFILHIVEDEGIVYTVFEVLNSRGLAVDWIDKCKSILLGIVYEVTEDPGSINLVMNELHVTWSNIYKVIGLNEIDGDDVITFAATFLSDKTLNKPLTAQDSLDFIKKYCANNTKRVISVSQFLLKVAEILLKNKRNRLINVITKIIHVRLLKVAIDLKEDISKEEKDDLITLWEKTSFKIFGIARKDSRSKVGDYVRLAKNIYNNKQSINSHSIAFPFEDIKKQLSELSSEFKTSEVLKTVIEGKDLYNDSDWKEELVYFFYKYEKFLNAKKGYNFPDLVWNEIWNAKSKDTIEHIYPQKPDYKWKKILPDEYKHRLGNLVVVTPQINSSASNKEFSEKKLVYQKENSLLGLQKIIEVEVWNEDSIIQRERELISWASSEWA